MQRTEKPIAFAVAAAATWSCARSGCNTEILNFSACQAVAVALCKCALFFWLTLGIGLTSQRSIESRCAM